MGDFSVMAVGIPVYTNRLSEYFLFSQMRLSCLTTSSASALNLIIYSGFQNYKYIFEVNYESQ